MAVSFWRRTFGNGVEIEANRISDCERFLRKKGDNYTIMDPGKNNKHVPWRESSRWGKLKYWNDVMTLNEKHEMQNERKSNVPGDYTEVINI